jgi:hypothetical protein
MKQAPIRDDAKHWRQRARESRSIADRLDDPAARRTMLQIAEAYEQLAELAEKRRASME